MNVPVRRGRRGVLLAVILWRGMGRRRRREERGGDD
jgi:hypothetical protein